MDEDEDEDLECPECGNRLTEAWSGVKCRNCGYTFCY